MSCQDSKRALHRQCRPKSDIVEKTAAFRQRRAADTAHWRERLHRGAAVYPVEVDGTIFDLMERFGGLKDSKSGDKQAVAIALGKVLRRALQALLREEAASRRLLGAWPRKRDWPNVRSWGEPDTPGWRE
jgi:hypothetical protein